MSVKNYQNLKKSTFKLLERANKQSGYAYAIGKKTVKKHPTNPFKDDEVYTLLKNGKEIAAGEEDDIRKALVKELLGEKWKVFKMFCREAFYNDVKVSKEEWKWAREVQQELGIGAYICSLIAKEVKA